jgi:hypothetical protein
MDNFLAADWSRLTGREGYFRQKSEASQDIVYVSNLWVKSTQDDVFTTATTGVEVELGFDLQ